MPGSNSSAYRCVPNWFGTCCAAIASSVAWIVLCGMDGSNTYTFGPSAPPVVDGATLDAVVADDAAVAVIGMAASPTNATTTASSLSVLMARSELSAAQ